MKVYKTDEDKLVFEGEEIKSFKTECTTDGNFTEDMDKFFEGIILSYRFKGMKNSKKMISGNKVSVLTLLSSTITTLIKQGMIDEDDLRKMFKLIHSYCFKKHE